MQFDPFLRDTAARLHVVQADSRPFVVHGGSRDLVYDAHDDSEATMHALNGGALARPWDYWAVSAVLNRLKCAVMGCAHHVLPIRPEDHRERHVTWGKIRILLDFMRAHPDAELVAFIDSDAFVRDEWAFLQLAHALRSAPGRHGALSRDPLMPKNTYINTGCLLFKNTEVSRAFLEAVWNDVAERPQYRYDWPHEQYAFSQFVLARRETFFVLRTAVLNTPCGAIVRHAWWKHQFAGIAEEELLSTIAQRHCPELTTTVARPAFDLTALLDDEATPGPG